MDTHKWLVVYGAMIKVYKKDPLFSELLSDELVLFVVISKK